ncbi:hypothetical protein C5167_013707 [Papaver somniferum]|uniref:Uncharacterized protein n=1 Tax=Papaver somniferum TaxID=3469 RepID=A0A4Y7J144_PAPSO|nr:hypothetical protein C5167_013707 [Papaver somniferum]
MSKISNSINNEHHCWAILFNCIRKSIQKNIKISHKTPQFPNSQQTCSRFSSSHGGVPISSPHIKAAHISSSDVNNIKKEDLFTSIPVRAYFMFSRIDFKGLMADNQANLIPQTSGMTNYALLKFGDCDSSPPQVVL